VSIQNYSYHINQQVFPILVRGRAYGITNFVSRPITGLSPIVTEYTDKPLAFIVVFASISLFTLRNIKILVNDDDSTSINDSDDSKIGVKDESLGQQDEKKGDIKCPTKIEL